jgi:uncharacterized protein YfcZ (UPF0381/DUF406 family)
MTKYAIPRDIQIDAKKKQGFAVQELDDCVILRSPPVVGAGGKTFFEAMAFSGKRSNRDFYFSFSSVVAREAHITEYLASLKRRAAWKVEAKKQRTEAGQVGAAKAIRIELKAAFPSIKFRVTSESYSMGDNVNISWTDGPTLESVEKITKKYQYGHFDGMEDIYEDSNVRKDIPQSKFVFVNRNMSEATEAVLKEKLAKYWGVDMNDARAVESRTCREAHELIHREFHKTDLSAGEVAKI